MDRISIQLKTRLAAARRRATTVLRPLFFGAGIAVAGCASPSQLPLLPATTASLPTALPVGLPPALPSGDSVSVPATTQEVYIRVARAGNACWFGGTGRLRQTHVFYADAAPEHKGGAVEAFIHERDRQSDRPWGSKAVRITMTGGDGATVVHVDRLKMSEAETARIRDEVFRWAVGDATCSPPTAEEVAAQAAAEAAARQAATVGKRKQKVRRSTTTSPR